MKLPRWNEVLIEIYKSQDRARYCEKINHRLDVSHAYLREVVKLLSENDLVEIIPSGKINKIILTEKGKSIALSLMKLSSELGRL